MRIALYIEKGYKQIILTPEDDYEKSVLNELKLHNYEVEIKQGEFYHNQAGFLRESPYDTKTSTMFVFREKG